MEDLTYEYKNPAAFLRILRLFIIIYYIFSVL